MALRIIDHYPDINEIDVARNIHVKAQFDKAIVPNSVVYSHFSVHDSNTYATVPGTLGVEYDSSGTAIIAVFQPTINFTANTKYYAYLFGTPNSIISTDGEQLSKTYSWEFTTGTDILVGQMPAGIPSGALESGIISGVAVTDSGTPISDLYMTVTATDPQHQEPNVVTQLSGIYITFNMDIASSLSELSGLITVTEDCVLY